MSDQDGGTFHSASHVLLPASVRKAAAERVSGAGMASFEPSGPHYRYDTNGDAKGRSVSILALTDIKPIARAAGVVNFDPKRSRDILDAIRSGTPLPPIMVTQDDGSAFRYSLYHGFHRFGLSVVLGFTHIPAVVF